MDINFFFSTSQSIFLAAPHPLRDNAYLPPHPAPTAGTEWVPLILSRAPPIGSIGYSILRCQSGKTRSLKDPRLLSRSIGGPHYKIRSAKPRGRGEELGYSEWSELFRLEGQEDFL